MEITNRGKQRFFSTLASLIRITDFILAGGGYFKNMVWIILAAIAGTLLAHHRHISALGWLLFALAAFITRFVVEGILVGLSLWVGEHLPDTATMESEPNHSVRPYRFGTVWAILNLVGGVYYAWLAVHALHEAWIGFAIYLFSSLLAVGIGIGLLRRNVLGFFLLYFSMTIAGIEEVSNWFQPSEAGLLCRVATNTAFFGMMALIAGYFYKRRKEFA